MDLLVYLSLFLCPFNLWRNWLRYFSWYVCAICHDFTNGHYDDRRCIKAVPRHYREASLALGATRWQTIYKVVLRAAVPGILTAVVFGMARAFGEALAIQMVIGNAAVMPTSLTTPASTLTSILTMGIGNTIMGTVENNVLWSLALILLLMSLLFNIVIRIIGKRGALK